MAKAKKFKSNTGAPVRVYGPDSPHPIEIPYYAPHYETDDKREIEILQGSPEVVEVKDTKKK